MKKVWLIRLSVVMLGLILLVASCAPAEPPPPAEPSPHEVVNLELYTAMVGSDPYVMGLAMAEMLEDLHPWLRATITETMGSADAVHSADALPPQRRKNVMYLMVLPSHEFVRASLGEPPYKRPFTDLSIAMAVSHAGFGFATYNPEIRTPKDLIGKKVGVFPKGSAIVTFSDALLKDAWGIYDQVDLSYNVPINFKDLMITGVLDATMVISLGTPTVTPGGFSASPYTSLVLGAKPTYWIPVIKEDIEKINQKHPWKAGLMEVSKGALGENNPPEDTGLISFAAQINCWDTADEEVVYEMVKFLDENMDEFARRTGRTLLVKLTPELPEERLHPGSQAYFKEKGY